MKSYNQYELVDFLKKKQRYMSAREIASETSGTLTTVHRKLNKMVGRKVEVKTKRIWTGRGNRKFAIKHYRYKR
jgi:hypothetical protein